MQTGNVDAPASRVLDLQTPIHCVSCGTELAPSALVCPACRALIHATSLKQLAADAEAATRGGDRFAARELWSQALQLLPPGSQQHAVITTRLAALSREIAEQGLVAPSSDSGDAADRRPWWQQGITGIGMLVLTLGSKLKFLLLGLTKASTFLSMFAFFATYWAIHGWPLALGIVVTIYIHEMGHVSMLHQLGIRASAPLFIPGVGALVMLKQHVGDPLTDAKIGLAGPLWGCGAAIAAGIVYAVTGAPIWRAIAQLTAFLNLFNLIPVWQLDGSRGLHVLARAERWLLVGVIIVVLAVTGQRVLFIVGAVAAWRAWEGEPGPGSRTMLGLFAALVAVLAFIAREVG